MVFKGVKVAAIAGAIMGALLGDPGAARAAEIEPVIVLLAHISDPAHGQADDFATSDFIGLGATVRIGRRHRFEADLLLGRKATNCRITDECAFSDWGAHAELKWYPLRRGEIRLAR